MHGSFPVRVIISLFSVAVIAGTIFYANATLPTEMELAQLTRGETFNATALSALISNMKNALYASLVLASACFAIILILIHQLNVTTNIIKGLKKD